MRTPTRVPVADDRFRQRMQHPLISGHHPMCPSPRPTWDTVNEIDSKLQDIKYMAEFAGELVNTLDGNGAKEGYFHITRDEDNRLAFSCYDMLRRVEDLLAFLQGASS